MAFGKRRGPDMAYSAGRDAAHQALRLQQIFIPMDPRHEPVLRAFYLGTLGLQEMRSPNYPPETDGFWAVSGKRQIFVGLTPPFTHDPALRPAFPVEAIDVLAATLSEAGHPITWDTSNPYMQQLIVTDPAGTQIALIAG